MPKLYFESLDELLAFLHFSESFLKLQILSFLMYFDIYKLHSVIGGKQLWSETYGAACVTFFLN